MVEKLPAQVEGNPGLARWVALVEKSGSHCHTQPHSQQALIGEEEGGVWNGTSGVVVGDVGGYDGGYCRVSHVTARSLSYLVLYMK